MKKVKIVLCSAVCAALFLVGCATTDKSNSKENLVRTEANEKKIKEAEVSPNIVFVTKLQKLLEEGKNQEAIALFQSLPKSLEKDLELKMLLGALYYSNSQFSEAIDLAQKVLEIDSENMDALELISMCNRASGDKKAYKQNAEKILQKDPYNVAVNIQNAQDYAVNKKYKLARDSYRKALVGDKDNSDALFGYGQMSYYLNDIKVAKQSFEQILEKDPENSDALSYMAKIYGEDENYLRAAKYVSDAIKVNPRNYDYWLDYGTYLRYQGKYDEAVEAWKHAVSLDPTYFLAYAYLAGNYDETGKLDLAMENYQKVIETNPKYFYAYEETAILAYHGGNYSAAINYFTKAYEYSPNYSYALMIAACYYKLKDAQNAKKILQAQMKKTNPQSLEFQMLRFFYDNYSKNAEVVLVQKINATESSTIRGKMLFYMGLYYELNGGEQMSNEYYAKVTSMKAPLFFEYRIAEWGLES